MAIDEREDKGKIKHSLVVIFTDSFDDIATLTFPSRLWLCSCRSASPGLAAIRSDYWRGVDGQTSRTLGKSRRERQFQSGAPGVGDREIENICKEPF